MAVRGSACHHFGADRGGRGDDSDGAEDARRVRRVEADEFAFVARVERRTPQGAREAVAG